jgi:PAS domain S-box-containing protein
MLHRRKHAALRSSRKPSSGKRPRRQNSETLLEALFRSTAGATGEIFFRSLVLELATLFKVHAAFVARITDPTHAKILALCEQGKVHEGPLLTVALSPCADILNAGIPTFCPRGARKKYPEEQLLQNLHIESYFGVPLNASSGVPLGVMIMLHTKPLTKTVPSPSLLMIIASRAAAELERLDMEDQRLDSEFRMRAIIDAAPFGAHLYELQDDGRLVFVGGNRSADRILGIRHHELVGKTIEEAFPGLEKEGIPEAYRKVASTGMPFETELVSYEQGQIAGAFEVHAFKTSQAHVSVFFRDVTERRKAERLAEEASRVKTTLLTNISHEFRTPITGILGLASLLHEEISAAAHRQMLEGITTSASRLHTTLDEIFSLAQLTSGEIQPRKISITPLSVLTRVRNHFAEAAQRKGLTLTLNPVEAGVRVVGDEELVADIVSYLVDNAIKYTNNGGITITVTSSAEHDADRCVIAVQDSGIGIAREHQETIFEEFKQISEGYGREFEGTGLGLAIARRMARMMGGTLSVESSPGNGSTFLLALPGSRTPIPFRETPPPGSPESTSSGTQPRVLIVEDNFINTMVMQKFLSGVCATDHARNARAAIDMALKNGYDAIVMDINLGAGMNGIEATQEIRKIPGYQGTPIVAVTGYTLAGDRERILSQGLTHYLPKPFDRNEIVEVVASALVRKNPL